MLPESDFELAEMPEDDLEESDLEEEDFEEPPDLFLSLLPEVLLPALPEIFDDDCPLTSPELLLPDVLWAPEDFILSLSDCDWFLSCESIKI